MVTKAQTKPVKSEQEKADDLELAEIIQAGMAMRGMHVDFRSDPSIMAMINGDITNEEFSRDTESNLQRAIKRSHGKIETT